MADEQARKPEEESRAATGEAGQGGPQVGTRYSAQEIHENILREADDELSRPWVELAISGLASGLSIGFSYLATALLSAHVPESDRPLAAAAAYPLGFVLVVLARHQLFTENTLEPVIPLLERRTLEQLRRVLRLWGIVLPANLVGAALFALVVARTRSLEMPNAGALLDVARGATSDGFGLTFLRAIWAGWLVALMAWLLASTRETIAQIALIVATTAPIAAFGFRHSIAGAVEAFYRVWMGDANLGALLWSFELPALLGNIIGGVVLVALVNHGQAGSRPAGV